MKILGQNFKVDFVDRSVITGSTIGNVDATTQTITIAKDLPEEVQNATLLHEVFHVLSDSMAVGLTEEQVEALSNGLYAFLSDNNIKFQYIIGGYCD